MRQNNVYDEKMQVIFSNKGGVKNYNFLQQNSKFKINE